MRKYDVIVVESGIAEPLKYFFTKAWTYGVMASGEMTWAFEGMEENAIYTASRMKIAGKMRYVLFRQ